MTGDGPVLADWRYQFHCERPRPVYSVTSDTANSVSFQTAHPKPAWPDPSQQANDSFGALVDSNIQAAAANDPAPAPQQ